VEKNRLEYGANEPLVFTSTPMLEFFMVPLRDPMLILLMIAAVIAIPIGLYEHNWD